MPDQSFGSHIRPQPSGLGFSGVPSNFILRQLDDTPVAGQSNSPWCETFYNTYINICKAINLELAENCPSMEKAFGVTTKGKVLGILFDSTI